MIRLLIFLLLISLFPNLLPAQDSLAIVNLQGKWMTVKDGLSQGHVHGILRDKQGFMWFSTSDGLNRYDGYEMKTFRHDPKDKYSLPDNSALDLMEDDNGNFWIRTEHKGLCLFDRKTERFYPLPEKYRTVFLVCRKELLFVHNQADICLYDISRVKPENYANPDIRLLFSYNAIQPLNKYKVKSGEYYWANWEKNGEIWVVFGYDFFRLMPNSSMTKWEICEYDLSFLKKDAIPAANMCIFPLPGKEDKYLIRHEKGVAIYDIVRKKKVLSLSAFYHPLLSLKSGEVIVYHENKCFLFNLETYQLMPLLINGIAENDFGFLIYEDKNDLAWLGTNGFGLIKCDRRLEKFTTYKVSKNKRFNNLMAYDWIKGYYEKTTFDTIDLGFQSLVRDNEGNFWYYRNRKESSQQNAMFYLQAKNSLAFYPQPILYGSNNGMIFRDNTDNIWIYADEGLQQKRIYRYNKKAQRADTSYYFPNVQDPGIIPFISQAWQDKKGIFWFATVKGLFRFDQANNKWQQWQHEANNPYSLSADLLYTLCPDPVQPEKYLWLGTAGQGFSRFEYATGKCTHFTEKDGLPNNTVYGILSDTLNNLWLSTNKGLSCFTPSRSNKLSKGEVEEDAFRNFSTEDGLQGEEFNRYTFLHLPNGKLMFGGVDGFVIFNPVEVLKKSPPLEMAFIGLSIANQPINWKTDSTVISAPIQYAKTITLQPNQNIFTLSFAILEYRDNNKKYYKYKLEGFDKDWTQMSTKNEATYTNLSPGTYTLHVKGRASDGVWNEEGIAIQIIVLPAWHQTKLCHFLFTCLIAGLLYALYRFRLRQMLKAEKLRNRIAQDLHDEIGSTLSSIGLYGEAAKKMVNGNAKAEKIMSIINESVAEMMEAMNDIVWAVNTQNDNLENLVNRMRSFAAHVCEAQNITLQFTDNEELATIHLDMIQRKNIYLIFKEALNNALKYAACTRISVTFSKEQNSLRMRIKDNGKGFRVDAMTKNMGGNGLKNMQNRAIEMKSKLYISSEEGNGTNIYLDISL